MSQTNWDVVVVGAGPAGVGAALESSACGLTTLLVDEEAAAGGQVYRAPRVDDKGDGAKLRAAMAASRVARRFNRRVWTIEPGFAVSMLGPEGNETVQAKALILATGAQERVVPVDGWTLPGVIGLAAATTLLKSQLVLPGVRTVVAGRGPLLAFVAATILEQGGEVAAVIDANPRSAWLRAVPSMLARADLLAQGALWTAQIAARRVPMFFNSAIVSMHGDERVRRVDVAKLGKDGRPVASATSSFACDTVCYGHGLLPATEATRLLGATHRFAADRGGWTVAVDDDQATSIANLYACGDGAGILGVAAAEPRGRIAALAAARDLGAIDEATFEARSRAPRRALARAQRFGATMASMIGPMRHQMALASATTTICRCEGLDRATLETAIDQGAASLDTLKASTRCGMGPCGGRFCTESAALLLAERTGRSQDQIALAAARPPLRPVPLGALTAGFRYEDLPIPAPAPL